MNSIKRLAIPLAAASILPSGVLAEGLERVNIDPSFMFETGSYAELGMGRVTPSIPSGGAIARDNVAPSFTASTVAVKTSVGEKFDVGIWHTTQGNGVNIDWGVVSGAGATIDADLSMPTLAGFVRYKFSDTFSIIGGLKRVSVDSGGTLSLPSAALGIASATWTTSATSATTSVYGIVSEIPEIAMRMTVLMEGAAALDIPVNYTQAGTGYAGAATGTAKASIGDATTISLQTGIAANTLLFGSLKMSNWQDDQVFLPYDNSANRFQVSDFGDGKSYTIGLGRKINDSLSGSVSLHRDPASDCDTASALSPKCETKSISVGAKYSLNDQMNLSLGGTWTQFGDATVPTLGSTTTKSVNTSLGAKLSFKF